MICLKFEAGVELIEGEKDFIVNASISLPRNFVEFQHLEEVEEHLGSRR
jgi:hypothetical protein